MKKTITDILSAYGTLNVGFCAFDNVKEHLLDCRAKSRLPQNAKTIIMCAFPYKVKENAPKFLSRYASVPDYHTVCGNILADACEKLSQIYPNNKFEYFCDNSPIPEVHTAAMAGIGVKGDNGLLITQEYGSYVFLGEIVTDLEIACENKYSECSHCGKCKQKCPVNLNKSECLSNLSQKKQLDNSELQILKKNNILWGCDICQNVCPMNKQAKITYITEFIDGYRDEYTLDEDSQGRPYTWRGEKVIKRNYENLVATLPNRKPNRLKNYDYSTPGYYFITLCVQNKKHLFKIENDNVRNDLCVVPSRQNLIIHKWLKETENKFNIRFDKYVIMPNHIHMIAVIAERHTGRSLQDAMRWFKTMTTNEYIIEVKRGKLKPFDKKLWQKSYYDHIIRGEQDYKEIWQYIENNPAKWEEDEFYT